MAGVGRRRPKESIAFGIKKQPIGPNEHAAIVAGRYVQFVATMTRPNRVRTQNLRNEPMNKLTTLAFIAAVAVSATVVKANADEAAVEPHQNVLDTCTLNENGEALLAQGLRNARYDAQSRAFMAFNILGFSTQEFTARTVEEQKADVKIRAARALSRIDDGAVLSIAHSEGLQGFFYDDTIVCLKASFQETDAERTKRETSEKAAAVAQAKRNAQAEAARQQELQKENAQAARMDDIQRDLATGNPAAALHNLLGPNFRF
jgi:transposase-like protein